ncbi:helix-turn-helix domain-containing protein [Streptomyces sp. NPDC046915]|uniref:helix-turn-helix domain-containing protein n=1 Tax=Streptomyces sp. NPDC046915 TaxID=3155257 RepID=UPI0033C7268E
MAGCAENPLDPGAGPVQRLASELRKLRSEAGSPTYRSMAQRTHQGASTLSQAAAGERLPTLPVVLAYVQACGGHPEEWEERWRQAAAEAAAEPRVEDEKAKPPHRGLARFEPADADLFFGCDELTERLFQQACLRRFTAVFGPSGSGKSSLLRAGLRERVVIAVRADFLGHCAQHPGLTAALRDGTVLAGPMSRDELREAVVKPAQAAGLIVERACCMTSLHSGNWASCPLPVMRSSHSP